MTSNDIPSANEIKTLIKCLIVSSPDMYSLYSLNIEFKKSIGYDIPFRRYGYNNLLDFLKSMPDVLSLKRLENGILYVVAEGENKAQHISYMVSKQKKKPSQPTRYNNYNQISNPIKIFEHDLAPTTNIGNHNYIKYESGNEEPAIAKNEESNKNSFNNTIISNQFEELDISLNSKQFCQICSKTQNTVNDGIEAPISFLNSEVEDDIESQWENEENEIYLFNIRLNAGEFVLNIQQPAFPDNLTSKKLHQIVITHIHNPHRFWFRIKSSDLMSYETFIEELNEFCKNDFYRRWNFQREHRQIGNVCCIYYKNMWYRAKILTRTQNQGKLYLIDIGLTINTDIKDMRYLPQKFSSPSFQTFRGSLEGIEPFQDRWNKEASNCFFKMSISVDLVKANIKFVKENVSYILAFGISKDFDNQFFNEILLEKNLAIRSTNDHFENKFPTFEMIENSEYPSIFEIRNMTNNLGIPYFSNELKLFKQFEYLSAQDLRELYLHFKHDLTNKITYNIDENCFVIEKMTNKKFETQNAKVKSDNRVKNIPTKTSNYNNEHLNSIKHTDVYAKVSEWLLQYNKRYGYH